MISFFGMKFRLNESGKVSSGSFSGGWCREVVRISCVQQVFSVSVSYASYHAEVCS